MYIAWVGMGLSVLCFMLFLAETNRRQTETRQADRQVQAATDRPRQTDRDRQVDRPRQTDRDRQAGRGGQTDRDRQAGTDRPRQILTLFRTETSMDEQTAGRLLFLK